MEKFTCIVWLTPLGCNEIFPGMINCWPWALLYSCCKYGICCWMTWTCASGFIEYVVKEFLTAVKKMWLSSNLRHPSWRHDRMAHRLLETGGIHTCHRHSGHSVVSQRRHHRVHSRHIDRVHRWRIHRHRCIHTAIHRRRVGSNSVRLLRLRTRRWSRCVPSLLLLLRASHQLLLLLLLRASHYLLLEHELDEKQRHFTPVN